MCRRILNIGKKGNGLRFFAYWMFPLAYCLSGCGTSSKGFRATQKYSPDQLQKDYTLFQSILETHHPSLYWYTPKDSMDYYFEWGKAQLKDSMTEPVFRKVLAYVTSKINCGHTSVRTSKAWSRYSDTIRQGRIFPLSFKTWEKATVVTGNLNRRDSILKRGTVIHSINGKPIEKLIDTMFNYISTDGYNETHKYQSLSNRGYFGSIYSSLYGLPDRFTIGFTDSTGQANTTTIPVYRPVVDTSQRGTRAFRPSTPQPSKRERKRQEAANVRLLKIDSVSKTAMMDLASFGRGYGLKKFFRQSFRTLRKNGIGHLIIDVRSNGGGSVTNSTFLSRHIADQRFKVADSLYATKKKSAYQKYIQDQQWNRLFMTFFTRKKRDGYYHFGYFERHRFKPKKKNHFDGKVYILTGGNSFSATTLFVSAVIKQENVIVIGEETGGGAYGNSAWLIPDATLPETGVRFRLPLFRLVIDKDVPKNGKGVQPEIYSGPTVDAVKRGVDYKLDKALELINKDKLEKSN